MPTYKQAGLFLLFVLALHAIALIWSLYYVLPWFDTPMHALGGLAMGLIALAVWQANVEQLTLRPKAILSARLLLYFFVLGFVAIVGIVWEWHEFALDALRAWHGVADHLAQPGLFDTMKDLFLDLAGGTTAFFVAQLASLKKPSA